MIIGCCLGLNKTPFEACRNVGDGGNWLFRSSSLSRISFELCGLKTDGWICSLLDDDCIRIIFGWWWWDEDDWSFNCVLLRCFIDDVANEISVKLSGDRRWIWESLGSSYLSMKKIKSNEKIFF